MEHTRQRREFFRYISLNILGMIGLACYLLADTFFVARGTGATGLAALNLAIPAYTLMNGLGLMIGVGGATRYAFCRAQGDDHAADRVFTCAASLGLAVGVLFLLAAVCAAAPAALLLGATGDTFPLTVVYLRTALSFSPFFVMNNVLLAFVRADGNPGCAMRAMLAGSLFNIVFDYLFIFPCQLGLFGAALATGISPMVSLLCLSAHLRRAARGFHLRRAQLRLSQLPALCAPGVSALIGELSSGLVLLLFNLTLLRLAGSTAVAAYGIIANLSLVAMAILQGLATGMQPLVSRASGAGETAAHRHLLRWGILTALGIATLLYALTARFAPALTAVFGGADDPSLARYAIPGLRLYFTGFWGAGVNIVLSAFLSAAGRPSAGFALSLVRGPIAIAPLLLLLTALYGVTGVWLTFPAAECLTALLSAGAGFRFFLTSSSHVHKTQETPSR